MKNVTSFVSKIGAVAGVTLGAFALAAFAASWTPPPPPGPPQNNVDAPINVGSSVQEKLGGIWVKGAFTLTDPLFTFKPSVAAVTPGSVLTALDTEGKVGWGAAGGGSLTMAHAFRRDGANSDTGSQAVARPIITISGSSAAFTAVNNVSAHASSLSSLNTLDGMTCSTGWKVAGCWISSDGNDNDIVPYSNGCVTNDFDSGTTKAELSMICIQTP